MSLIDLILNVAGLLLWLSWRSIRFDPALRAQPATLAGTLRRAEPLRLKRWHFLASLAALLFVRALFYWQVGPAVNWTPKLDLGVVAPAFRAYEFLPSLLFSALSFLRLLIVFYFWLLVLAMINRQSAEPDPMHKMILLQLGRVGHWPRWFQSMLPLLVIGALWIMVHPLLVHFGVTRPVQASSHLLGQALVVGLSVWLSLKLLLPAVLLIHLISSYVYLGNSPVWEFIDTTARNLLLPLKPVPLRVGKVDLAPVAGIILILLLLHGLPSTLLRELNKHNLTIWPQ